MARPSGHGEHDRATWPPPSCSPACWQRRGTTKRRPRRPRRSCTPTAAGERRRGPLRTDRARQGPPLVSGGPAGPTTTLRRAIGGRSYRIGGAVSSRRRGARRRRVDGSASAVSGPFPDGCRAAGSGEGSTPCTSWTSSFGSTALLMSTPARPAMPVRQRIGLATSGDGVHWDVAPPSSCATASTANTSGVGSRRCCAWTAGSTEFTDTSGAAANSPGPGSSCSGRRTRPSPPACRPWTPTVPGCATTKVKRSLSIANAYSADWMWVDA